jgi:hypothetical protein
VSDRTTPNPSEREVPPDQSQEEVPLDQPEQEASLDQPEQGLFGSGANWPRLLAGIGLIVLLGAAFLLGTRFGSQANQDPARIASVPASPTPMSGISRAGSPAATATARQEATHTPTPQPTPSPTATPNGPIYPLAVIVENMIAVEENNCRQARTYLQELARKNFLFYGPVARKAREILEKWNA